MCKIRKVFICENCKDIWISTKKIICCESCGCKSLTKTHGSNYRNAINFDKNDFRSYFNFPLKMHEGIDTVFDSNSMRVFDFELGVKDNPVISMTRGTKERIVAMLNLQDHTPTRDLNLVYEQETGIILLDGKSFISIRGLPRLISNNYNANCYGLNENEAKLIQTELAEFIMKRLSIKYTIS